MLFYAAETHANGTLSVFSFTDQNLRTAWVDHGMPHDQPGYRDNLCPADAESYPVIHDGDQIAWYLQALERITNTPALTVHKEILSYDWNIPDHWKWVVTESIEAIIDWAEYISLSNLLDSLSNS